MPATRGGRGLVTTRSRLGRAHGRSYAIPNFLIASWYHSNDSEYHCVASSRQPAAR